MDRQASNLCFVNSDVFHPIPMQALWLKYSQQINIPNELVQYVYTLDCVSHGEVS